MSASSIQAAWLPPDNRLHLSHGPIDLIIKAEGRAAQHAYRKAIHAMQYLLERLVVELPSLRQKTQVPDQYQHPIARRMAAATGGYGNRFITPMAAVAGAVADHVLAAMTAESGLTKASVNNGGDIAFWLADGYDMTAVMANLDTARCTITHDSHCRGIATSGYGGRSFSLGIADAVVVLADNAANADAAATMIANAVTLPSDLPSDHPDSQAVTRMAANAIFPESDLGDQLVVRSVGALSATAIDYALDAGEDEAKAIMAVKPIAGALIRVKDHIRVVGLDHYMNTPRIQQMEITT